MSSEAFDLVVRGASQVLTCAGATGPAEALLGAIEHGVVGVRGERIVFVGEAAALPAGAIGPGTQLVDARGGFVGPGLIDPHTHVVFAGERADEFELRCQGKSYLQIAQAGGGIVRTVRATQDATVAQLVELALPRLRRLFRQGVTCVEVKTGYGLSVDAELRMLDAIAELRRVQPVRLVSTLLPLHALPKSYVDRRAEFVALMRDELLPRAAARGDVTFCDAFVEQSAFTHEETRDVLGKAKALGFKLRLHVDQLTANQGAQLAAELGAVSADHLEQIDAAGISALKAAGVVPVLAPTSTLFAKVRPFAPGRALSDAGLGVALCTNCNPGSSNSENVSLAMGLACLENGLTPAEAYLGFTRWAAAAIADPERGRLQVGGPADLAVYAAPSYRELPYHLGMNDVRAVVCRGRLTDFEA